MNNEQTNHSEQQIPPIEAPISNIPFYLILWGIIFFLFYGMLYIEKTSPDFEGIDELLIVLFPIGAVMTFFYRKKTTKKDNPARRAFLYSWGGVTLSLIVWLASNDTYQSNLYLALTVLLFGLASFVTGGVNKFIPSIVGGLICIVLSALIPSIIIPFQYLVVAAGSLFSFLIPGLILRYQTENSKTEIKPQ